MFDSNHILPDKGFKKTGYITTSNGYTAIYKTTYPSKYNYVQEHRLIMELHLQRYLEEDEVVHHINRNKTDNRLCNLQLMSKASHRALHNDEDKKYERYYNVDKVKELYLSGMSTRVIGDELSIGKSTVASYIKELGISRPNMSKRDEKGKFKGGN